MKLFQALAGAEHGGAEAFFERLAVGLHRAGQAQQVTVRSPARAARLAAAGVDVQALRFGGPLDVLTRWQLHRAITTYKPDVVLTWMNRATALCPRGKFVHVARLGGYYDLKHYARCDHLIGNTRDIVAYLVRNGWSPDRAHYLPNFVSVEKAPKLNRAAFDTPDDAPLALALGRLHPNKAFDIALAALARVPRLHLWIAGEGPERARLEADARRLGVLGRVRFLGWRDDVAALLATADLLLCPSRHEPLGNVVIEAWAAGRPVVAAASAGPRDLIRSEETGLVVPVDDAAALAAAVDRLIADPSLAERLVTAGSAAYAAEFTERVVVDRYRSFLQEVAR